MTTYRVGEAGATVFDSEGRELSRLAPGTVVVPGATDIPGSLAQQHATSEARRIARYADKRLRVDEDKAR